MNISQTKFHLVADASLKSRLSYKVGLWLILLLVLPRPAFALGDWDNVLKVRSLSEESRKAHVAYWAEVHAAKTAQEREILASKNPDLVFAPRFLEMAQKWKTNSEAAAEALVYAVYGNTDGPVGDKALELLARDHVNSQPLELLFQSYPLPCDDAATQFFHAIAERSTKRTYQGQALMVLADFLQDSKPEEAEKLYKQVIEKYAEVQSIRARGQKLGSLAERSLRVCSGKVAPDFSVEDIEGRTFKLSEDRGKVMLLSFCAQGCAPCRALYPYWRSLVARKTGDPFDLVLIMFDSKKSLLEARKREAVTWRVICDGDATNHPSINTEWSVNGWPNLYLLDRHGVIRHHWVGSPGTNIIDHAVDALLMEPEPGTSSRN